MGVSPAAHVKPAADLVVQSIPVPESRVPAPARNCLQQLANLTDEQENCGVGLVVGVVVRVVVTVVVGARGGAGSGRAMIGIAPRRAKVRSWNPFMMVQVG